MPIPSRSLASIAAAHLLHAPALAAPPAEFVAEPVGTGWSEVVGTTFMPDGRAVVWERGGRVWIVNTDGTRLPEPLLDIRDEVGAWRDYGLLGVVLHPEFATNGWYYCLYVVDRHHLDFAGTAQYDPAANAYYAATIGRITRYAARPETGFTETDPASRTVLVGADAAGGIPILHQSHGLGAMAFGTDGTLLLATGDSASYLQVDVGGQVADGYIDDALARGILRAKENVGAWRSQLVDCLCGKVLRLDPETGAGVEGNPFFDPAAPFAARSRVWALGLRNPYRMSIVEGSGSHAPVEADPGVLHVGDVGWTAWEDVQTCDAPGLNFGWPAFEGLSPRTNYLAAAPVNYDSPTGLASPAFRRFHELVFEASLDPTGSLPVDASRFRQAESATANGAPVATNMGGFHGTGFRDFVANSGEWIDFAFTVKSGGPHRLVVRHANGGASSRPLRVRVDGVVATGAIDFPPTGAWTEWRLVEIPLDLAAGTRTIRLETTGSSGPNVDEVALLAQDDALPLLPGAGSWNVHRRPILDWSHSGGLARTPAFASGAATTVVVGDAGGAAGTPFNGSCTIGGPLVHAHDWPAPWDDALFFGDYGGGWIRAATLSESGEVTAVALFDGAVPLLTSLAFNHHDSTLWMTRWPSTVVRYRHAPTAGQPPVAVLEASPAFGPSPLSTTLSAEGSSDPEGATLEYRWDLGDGTPPFTGGATVSHTYTAPRGAQARHDATVTVRDPQGNERAATVVVSVNNTPPVVAITSLYDGQLYPMTGDTTFPLRALVSDAESDPDAVSCTWTTVLHHNTHTHGEPPDAACETGTVISALGCDGETYFFEVLLEVVDEGGLSASDRVLLFPDCEGWLACPADLDHDGAVDAADLAVVLSAWGLPGPTDLDHSGATDGADLALLLDAWGPCEPDAGP